MARSLGGYDQGYGGGDYSPPARRVFGRVNKAPGDPSGIAPGGDGSGGGYGAGGSAPTTQARQSAWTGGTGGPNDTNPWSGGGTDGAGNPVSLGGGLATYGGDPYSATPTTDQQQYDKERAAAGAAAQAGYTNYLKSLNLSQDAINGAGDVRANATGKVDFSAIDNYDPSAALTQYAQGGMKMFNQNLGDALYDTQNKDASLGRLNTGYFDRDRGMTMSRVANQWQGAFADKALEAAQIKAGLLGKSGDLHLGQANFEDTMAQRAAEDKLGGQMGLTSQNADMYNQAANRSGEMAAGDLDRALQAVQTAMLAHAAGQQNTINWAALALQYGPSVINWLKGLFGGGGGDTGGGSGPGHTYGPGGYSGGGYHPGVPGSQPHFG